MEELRGLSGVGRLLGPSESLRAATRARNVIGVGSPLRASGSISRRALDVVRQARRSLVVIVTGQRVLICRRALWSGKPKVVLLARPISDFAGGEIIASTGLTEPALPFQSATKQGAQIHLRNGETWEIQVFGEAAEGMRYIRWDELRTFVYELNGLISPAA